uniref:Non-specific serine/threonine protein kinase n=1 Tax=Rhabditophanes sp. KR3021 TaxID=114890 RepID=A0AC35TSI9_9BILA
MQQMERFNDFQYFKSDIVGSGSFALVFKGINWKTQEDVAIKAIKRKTITSKANLLAKEIKILNALSELKHENLVGLINCLECNDHVFIVLEFCNGGDLSDYLGLKGKLEEPVIQHFSIHIARALKAMFTKDIVHRDLKPQNLLINVNKRKTFKYADIKDFNYKDLVLKIADFGFARILSENNMAATLCGSPMYMAPEVIMSHHYGAKADLWSIGTILYQSLTGMAPFKANTPTELKRKYQMAHELVPDIPQSCSRPLKDLLIRLLKKNPTDRIEFEEFFTHPFLSTVIAAPVPRTEERFTPGQQNIPSQRHQLANGPPSPYSVSPSPNRRQLPSTNAVKATITPQPRSTSDFSKQPLYRPQQVPPPTQMQDSSSDFVMVPSMKGRTPTTRTSSLDHQNPVRQVQVHSTNAKAVPVPSQRMSYQKIEEHRLLTKANSGTSLSPSSSHSPTTFGDPRHQSTKTTYNPQPQVKGPAYQSVENISVPATKFVINETKRQASFERSRRSTLANIAEETRLGSSSSTSKMPVDTKLNQPNIPRSVTAHTPLSCVGADEVPGVIESVKLFIDPLPSIGSRISSNEKMDESQDDEMGSVNLDEKKESKSGDSEQMMDSVSGDETTATTASSGVYLSTSKNPVSSGSPNQMIIEEECSSSSSLKSTHKSVADFKESIRMMDHEPLPDLQEETVLTEEHKQILAKLKFILELVDTLISVADSKANNIFQIMEDDSKIRNGSLNADAYRRAEQLVVYVRALHMLSSALLMAQKQVDSDTLHPSAAVQLVLNQLNERYHHCLLKSQELASLGIPGANPSLAVVSAEKIMYKHAIDLCQTAALDELFGNPHLCPKRYQTAFMMLHTLSEQTQNEQDKMVLSKYKNAVEKRLRILEKQGFVTAVANN